MRGELKMRKLKGNKENYTLKQYNSELYKLINMIDQYNSKCDLDKILDLLGIEKENLPNFQFISLTSNSRIIPPFYILIQKIGESFTWSIHDFNSELIDSGYLYLPGLSDNDIVKEYVIKYAFVNFINKTYSFIKVDKDNINNKFEIKIQEEKK